MPPKKVSLPPNPPPDPSQSLPLAYSTFFSVAPLNAKNVSSSYLKTEAQTWISRSQAALAAQQGGTARGRKRKRLAANATGAAAGEADEPDVAVDDEVDESDDDDGEEGQERPSGPASRTIVIHPGSDSIRIGRATDLYPLTFPNAIARRPKLPPKQPQPEVAATTDSVPQTNGEGPSNLRRSPASNGATTKGPAMAEAATVEQKVDDDGIETPEPEGNPDGQGATGPVKGGSVKKAKQQNALDQGIEAIRNDLRAIMRQEKLRPVGNGKTLAANYNDGVNPEDVPEHNDFFGLDWTDEDVGGEGTTLVGEKALRLACFSQAKTEKPKQTRRQAAEGAKRVSPPDAGRPWKLFRPFRSGTLDLNAYEEHYGPSAAVQALLGDVRTIFEHAITSPPEDPDSRQESTEVTSHGLGIPLEEWEEHSVIVVLPDLFSRSDLKALVELLLQDMGFAGACVQTESVCATFGAGLSSACVVDLGAEQTSISCVEEGLVLPETRIALSYGGTDLSHFLGELLVRSKFPYREIAWRDNLADAMLLDSLKERLVTLNPADVGLNIHDFYLRLPDRPTVKYLFRTYDELILGPMSFFDPDVFGLDKKRLLKGKFRAGYTDELPEDEAVVEDAPELGVGYGADVPVTTAMQSCVKHLLPPPAAPAAASNAAASTAATGGLTPAAGATLAPAGSEPATPAGSVPPPDKPEAVVVPKAEEERPTLASRTASPSASVAPGEVGGPLASGEPSARPSPSLVTPAPGAPAVAEAAAPQPEEQPKPTIDVPFEASRTPLDQAVFHSILACISAAGSAGEERVKKMANNILCVGGSALVPGLASALEARLNAHFAAHAAQTTGDATNAPKVTVIPPPRDMDPRSLAWKGMAVFARLDSAAEMWIRREDWQMFGFRAVKEKTLFL